MCLHDRTGRLENSQTTIAISVNLHDRTGRLESDALGVANLDKLHDRTGRLEKIILTTRRGSDLHDRTGRLENIAKLSLCNRATSRPHRSLRNHKSSQAWRWLDFTTAQVA